MGNPPPTSTPPESTTVIASDERVENTGGSYGTDNRKKWSKKTTITTTRLLRHVERSHARIPGIRKIPLRAIGIILSIGVLNAVVWVAAAIVLVGALSLPSSPDDVANMGYDSVTIRKSGIEYSV